MIIAETIAQVREVIAGVRASGKTIGCVPTMGGLHEGHLSLLRRCRAECDFAVVTIFVNPTQFGPGEDLESYPRTFEADRAACEEIGVDLIFAPSVKEMYGEENLSWVNVEKISSHLCGASRPHFFRGVCTVVAKLFNIVTPDIAYFGQKDAQQLAVIRRMAADLNFFVEIRSCPTVREADGLALSSRNQYLDADQRRQAVCLSRALERARQLVASGETNPGAVIAAMKEIIARESQGRIDYISIVDNELLQPVARIDRPVLIALAVHLGTARLIDNITAAPAKK
ncbi:MAG: pantoate--beta-alanine ligase [Phycisphaerae bacterium SM23_30]|nr:MAG: pantoate--beta-alanine ligase [Phycisphaerae bacterium SM23_30]